jgi:putative endonuclease
MAGQSAQRLSREKGTRFEKLALDYLRAEGLELLVKNFRCRRGEIDLIMHDSSCLVFVEVRYRAANRFASAAHSVDARKQAKIAHTAEVFLGKYAHFGDHPVRFDVVAFDGEAGEQGSVHWIQDAFRV